MSAHDFLRAQRATQDLWPHRFLRALRTAGSADDLECWLPEFRRRFRNRVPDFAGPGLFATLTSVESLEPAELADSILDHVFLALRRHQPDDDRAFVDYVRRCIRSVAVTMRRQSLDSLHRGAVRDGELQVLSLDENPALLEIVAGETGDPADELSGRKVVLYLLDRAASDGERENVEIVIRSALDDVALAEIARERGVSRQAIQKRYQRGLSYLREHHAAVVAGG